MYAQFPPGRIAALRGMDELQARQARRPHAGLLRQDVEWRGSRQAKRRGEASPKLAVVLTSYRAHFEVLSQYLLSFEANVRDAHRCRHLVVVSHTEEAAKLGRMLAPYTPRLPRVMPLLTIEELPGVIRRLDPNSTLALLPAAKNLGRLGRLYVCVKKAYALRYAHEVLDVEHALVTDSEAYVWKPISIGAVFSQEAHRPTVWFADAPLHHKTPRRSREGPSIDANWCALHVYSDARGASAAQIRRQLPAPTATLFEYMGFFYQRRVFREYWASVTTTWQRLSFFDALVAAHEAVPSCLAVGFWFEVSWLLFLFNRHRPQYEARNVTAAIERAFGSAFVERSLYVNARLELLTRALSNQSLGAFQRFFSQTQLPFFRSDFRGASGRQGSRSSCLPVAMVSSIAAPAASFQVNSAVPSWAFSACADQLPAKGLPWVAHRIRT